MDISMDIHAKSCGYGYGYGWDISYPRQACPAPDLLGWAQYPPRWTPSASRRFSGPLNTKSWLLQWRGWASFSSPFIIVQTKAKQDNVRTNTESVQCHHVFDTAYVAPALRSHRLRDQSIRHRPIPTGGPLELILNLLPL